MNQSPFRDMLTEEQWAAAVEGAVRAIKRAAFAASRRGETDKALTLLRAAKETP